MARVDTNPRLLRTELFLHRVDVRRQGLLVSDGSKELPLL